MAIEIKKSHKGLFGSFAEANGMSVSEAARYVLDNKDSYSPERVKQANFAHNAESWEHKADGGEIEGYAGGGGVDGEFDSVLKEIATKEANLKAEREKRYKELQNKAQQERDAKRRADLLEQARQYDNTLKQREIALNYKKERVTDLINKYKSAPETTSNFNKAKENYVPELRAAIKDYQDTYSKYHPSEDSTSKSGSVKPDTGGINYMQGRNFDSSVKQFPLSNSKQAGSDQVASNPTVKRQNKPLQTTSAQRSVLSPDYLQPANVSQIQTSNPDDLQLKTSTPSQAEQNFINQTNGGTELPKGTQPINTGNKSKFDFSNVLGNAVNYGIPALQTAIGLRNLKQAGNRPKDQLDYDYLQALNKEKQNVLKAESQAKYGFNPEERAYLDMQNQNITNAGRYNARNLTGGSSANALGAERAVLNDSFGRALQTSINDRNLQLQKQQSAMDRQRTVDQLVADKQDRLRQYFNDDLTAWHQKTQSAAALTSTGLSNALDSYRADQRLKNFNKQMEFANQSNNPYNYNQ